mmetsp:Transcript_23392/g.46635  ORF Transcript_23392/g.46635 Transcript_23392/m.46635 type:complete len:474 (-) Transcript_23392:95-1516(-)
MCVARPCNVLGTSPIFHAQHALSNHLSRVGPHNMHPENFIRFFIRQHLDEAIRASVRPGPRIGRKRKGPLVVGHARLLQLLLGLSHGRHLRIGIDDARDGIVVDVSREPRHGLDRGDALLLRFMGEHGPVHGIPDRKDGGHLRPELSVHLDPSQPIGGDAQRLQAQSVGVRAASGGDQDHVVGVGLLAAPRALFGGDVDPVVGHFRVCDLGLELEFEPLLLERRLKLLGELHVHGGAQPVHEFDDRHLRAQPAPHRPHLQPDDPAADHRHLFGDGGDIEGARAVDDFSRGVVHRGRREGRHLRSRGEQHVLRRQRLRSPRVQRHLHTIRTPQTPLPLEVVHLVFLQQVLDAAGEARHGLGLGVEHRAHVHRHLAADVNAVLREIVFGVVEVVGALQQRFGGDAAHVQAGAPEGAAHLHARRLQAQLARFDGRDVAARSSPDYHHVVLVAQGGAGRSEGPRSDRPRRGGGKGTS